MVFHEASSLAVDDLALSADALQSSADLLTGTDLSLAFAAADGPWSVSPWDAVAPSVCANLPLTSVAVDLNWPWSDEFGKASAGICSAADSLSAPLAFD